MYARATAITARAVHVSARRAARFKRERSGLDEAGSVLAVCFGWSTIVIAFSTVANVRVMCTVERPHGRSS
jgi:hypothetical protein